MSREWQQTKYKEYVMPDAVYYQSVWAVRDLERMENRLAELEQEEIAGGRSIVSDRTSNFVLYRPTEEKAVERAVLRERIRGIHAALSMVPEEYRSFILSNLILKNTGKAFPNKLWRYWKQRFLYTVAKNLSMM
ncbi:hypothetical protein AALA22_12725 [Anaerovoracaceae bacterium 41-7]|uniref:Uncharacterized protein n=1 Tax=Anaerotruncus colihominis TaxID=169435 RepID=A0A845QJW2_9FIRM|nr:MULTISPECIES: hypothetical protein [Clostridia]MCI9640697.1 hypothetical protein [Emergencia sp.]NBH62482.1 hypothetical protein [Anaerotruncus colihominis]NCF00214.1 hypothetical protein [Emergencia sp. 1XD21-10]NCF03137.1 hypothetical protein [Anaerotruncus sp. 80]